MLLTKGRIFIAFSISILTCGICFIAGLYCESTSTLIIRRDSKGVVVCSKHNVTGVNRVWNLWTDNTVLGTEPGRELRRWMLASNDVDRLVDCSSISLAEVNRTGGTPNVVLFGRQAERIWTEASFPNLGELWIVHPLSMPPASFLNLPARTIVVVLPQIDEACVNGAWGKWVQRVGGTVKYSAECGLDIRHDWPSNAPTMAPEQ